MSEVLITDDGDERIFVSVDGQRIATIDHETYGWYGMEKAVTLLLDLADEVGFKVDNEQGLV